MFRSIFRVSLFVATAFAISCSSPQSGGVAPNSGMASEFHDAPEWVRTMNCSSPQVEKGASVVCGVGSHLILSTRQMSVARTAALTKAASAAALTIKGHVETLNKTYEGEYAQGIERTAADADAKTGSYSERWAKMDLPGFQPKDTWISPSNNVYVLGVVDVETVLNTLKKFDGLTKRQKETIDAHEAELAEMLKAK